MIQLKKDNTKFNIQDITVPNSEISDSELIEQVKIKGFIAYGSIVRRYNQRMFRVARSIVTDDAAAMDIVQDSHIKAFVALKSFQGKSSFFAWLASITRNEALMFLRKHKKEVAMGEDEQSILESMDSDNERIDSQPDNQFQNRQMQNIINQNLDKLSEKFRSVFVLRAVEQFSTKETAKILSINEITVKTRYFRAKRFLRGEIESYLAASNQKIYEFGNKNCDIVLFNVLTALSKFTKLTELEKL
jgi:RNA polymerase sigma-70 factor (ECF subfamily)